MNYYELTYLIPISLNEQEIEELSKKIEEFLQTEKIDKKEGILRKKLAYPISGESQAFLISIFFQSEPADILKLKKYLKEEGKILRHLIIKTKPQEEEREEEDPKKTPLFRPSQKPKVELSEIDKKIEEILED